MKTSLWLGVLVALVLSLVGAQVALAHATLERAEPAPGSAVRPSPPVIRMWFTEDLEPANTFARVVDPTGTQVDSGDSHVTRQDTKEMDVSLPPLPDGLYTVVFETQSATDGHVINGSFSFTVGDAPLGTRSGREIMDLMQASDFDAFPRWGEVLARAFNLLALSLLVGGILFPLVILLPAARAIVRNESPLANAWGFVAGLLSGRRSQATPAVTTDARTQVAQGLDTWGVRWKRTLRACILLYGLASLGILVMQATIGTGTLSDVPRVLTGTRFGVIWLARIATLLLLAVVMERVRWNWQVEARPPLGYWAAVLIGLGLLLTQSETSHSASVSDLVTFSLVADFVHLLGTAVWLGGLAQLLFTVPAFIGGMPRAAQPRVLGAVIGSFSLTAFVTVGAIVLSGLYALWVHVGSVDAFFATLYGTSLFVKFLLILPLLALAALNLMVNQPALAAAAIERARQYIPRFRIAVAAEMLLIALLLLAVGVMTSVAPAETAFASAPALIQQTQMGDDLRIVLGVAPGKLGTNDFGVRVLDSAGRPVSDAQVVRIYGTMQDMEMGTQTADAEPQGNGFYTLRGDLLGMIGNWQLRVLVRRAGKYDTNVDFNINALPANVPASIVPPPLWTRSDVQTGLGLTVVAFLAGTVLVLTRKLKRRLTYAGLSGCIAAAVLGVIIVYSGVQASPKPYVYRVPYAPDEARLLRSPLVQDQVTVKQGGLLYQQHCAVCHGVNAKGDGPAAANLYPPPVDLTVHANLHPEGNLYWWITDGIEGSAMPAWEQQLDATRRWQLVAYIRSLAPRAGFTPQP